MKYCIAGLIWDVRIFDILCIGEIIVANQAHFNGYGYFTGVSTCTTLFYQYRWKSGVRAFANCGCQRNPTYYEKTRYQ